MINHPLILLADEPTGNLNSEASEKVMECFSKYNRERPDHRMVTHSLKSACRGSRILFLKDGSIADNHFYDIDKNDESSEDKLFNLVERNGLVDRNLILT
jgi:putative ABC transport system ATP-binding protein